MLVYSQCDQKHQTHCRTKANYTITETDLSLCSSCCYIAKEAVAINQSLSTFSTINVGVRVALVLLSMTAGQAHKHSARLTK